MTTGAIPRISTLQLKNDIELIRALSGINGYTPHNPTYSLESATVALEQLDKSETRRHPRLERPRRRPQRPHLRPQRRPQDRDERKGRSRRPLRPRLRPDRRTGDEEEIRTQPAQAQRQGC